MHQERVDAKEKDHLNINKKHTMHQKITQQKTKWLSHQREFTMFKLEIHNPTILTYSCNDLAIKDGRNCVSNLPNDHGVLIGSLPALLGEERGDAAGPVQEHPPGDPMEMLLFLRVAPRPRLLPLPPPRPLRPQRRRRGGRRAGGAALPVRRQAGPHSEGPDHAQYALQTSQAAAPDLLPSCRLRRGLPPTRPPPPLLPNKPFEGSQTHGSIHSD